jgi:hypothetical protein
MAEAEKFFSQWKCQFFDKNSQKKSILNSQNLGNNTDRLPFTSMMK